MKKILLTALKYLVFLGLGIWIIYHMLSELSAGQRKELVDAFYKINPWYLIPIFIVGFLSHFFRGLRWRYLLESVGARPSVMNTTFAVLIGYITNLAIPRAGEVAKCTVLARYEKVPAHKMIGTIVAERAFDILCLVVISVIAFMVQFTVISGYVSGKMHLLIEKIKQHQYILMASVTAFIILNIVMFVIYRKNKETRVGKIVKELNHGILSIFRMKKKWQFMVYTLLMWSMYLGQIAIGLWSLPYTHHLSAMAAMVVLAYGSVGMIITPGGIGLYTLMVAQILTVYDIPDVPAQAFGWIAWAVQTGIILILGVLSLLFIHSYNRRINGQAGLDKAAGI